jgi:hypothetical protein
MLGREENELWNKRHSLIGSQTMVIHQQMTLQRYECLEYFFDNRCLKFFAESSELEQK